MGWKSWKKERLERHTGVRLYRYSLPRGVEFSHDARTILVPTEVTVVFDVGANIGQSAQRFKDIYPKADIFCFEPVLSAFEELCHNSNQWNQVKTYHLALGEFTGTKTINIFPFSPVNSFVNNSSSNQHEIVHVKKLDDFCTEHDVTSIDLLKIDVEGYELEVLKGAERMLSEQRIRSLYLESSPVQNEDIPHIVPLQKIDEFLAPYGYSIFGIYEQERDQFRNINYLCYFNVGFMLRTLCEQEHPIP